MCSGQSPANQRLAQQFGFSVDALRIRRVLFDVCGFFLPVENIVGAVVNEQRPRCRGCRGQVPGSMAIDQERFFLPGFTGVDLREAAALMTTSGRNSFSFA